MGKTTIARGSATRAANKNRRRENILSVAREIIAHDGFEAFTLNQLANQAKVTVPTIHNLIGKRSDIFKRLVEEMVTRIERAITQPEVKDPITAAEVFTDKLMELFAADEAFYKAAFVAGERTKLFEHELPTGIFSKSLKLALQTCIDAKNNDFLEGNIDSHWLAQQLFGCQRLARQDWVNGYIDLELYRTQVLTGMFITLAADATPKFRARLLAKIETLIQ